MREALQGTPKHDHPGEVEIVQPRVRLVAYTAEPYHLAVASARTCYASEFVYVGQITPKGERARITLEDALPGHAAQLARIGRLDTPHDERIRIVEQLQEDAPDDAARDALMVYADQARRRSIGEDRIAQSIYEAGHHTPFQHPTFVFALEDVSRNVVESFLHNHTFYNSEQQSQRYVAMKQPRVHVPESIGSNPEALAIYTDAVTHSWSAYHDLRELLVDANIRVMTAIGRIKGQNDDAIRKEAEKKSQEMARYVIPICAQTQLYHTVSGIVLLRYVRMCEAGNVPGEARTLVESMVEEVRKVDPGFVEKIREQIRPRSEHLEHHLTSAGNQSSTKHLSEPSESVSQLLHATPDAGARVAQAIREVTGSDESDEALLQQILNPAANAAWNDTLNTWDHSPILRTLRHVHYTFHKRLSLTAHAQDQRHRMTPGSRPLLSRCLTRDPDVHTPDIIMANNEARAIFDEAVRVLWQAMLALRDQHGIPADDCTYLLPNATHITFTQSGDLLSFIHKWRLRLCFNAQKEIFDASIEELRQVQAVHPELTNWIGPPCSFIAAAQPPELQDSVEACCPEGPRWCGVKVWRNFDAIKGVPKRPY